MVKFFMILGFIYPAIQTTIKDSPTINKSEYSLLSLTEDPDKDNHKFFNKIKIVYK